LRFKAGAWLVLTLVAFTAEVVRAWCLFFAEQQLAHLVKLKHCLPDWPLTHGRRCTSGCMTSPSLRSAPPTCAKRRMTSMWVPPVPLLPLLPLLPLPGAAAAAAAAATVSLIAGHPSALPHAAVAAVLVLSQVTTHGSPGSYPCRCTAGPAPQEFEGSYTHHNQPYCNAPPMHRLMRALIACVHLGRWAPCARSVTAATCTRPRTRCMGCIAIDPLDG